MNKQYLFELSGEHQTMCSAEAKKCIEAETDSLKVINEGPGFVIAEFDEKKLDGISDRIALTHRIGKHLGSFDLNNLDFESIELPEGTFAIKGKRFEGMMKEIDSQDLIRKMGAVLSKKNDVNLKHPDNQVIMLMSDKIHIFLAEKEIDRNILETRKVGERPFFSPISLHPRYARALINLTGAKRGDVVLDPFCGTGGIVIEAAFMGMKAIGSDFDEEMIAGTQENMDFYGLKLHDMDVIDVSEIKDRFGEVDAIATDPPYGRSTCTGGEDVESIFSRGLDAISETVKKDHVAGVIAPHVLKHENLSLQSIFVQRVHGSLSRHYHFFKK